MDGLRPFSLTLYQLAFITEITKGERSYSCGKSGNYSLENVEIIPWLGNKNGKTEQQEHSKKIIKRTLKRCSNATMKNCKEKCQIH